MFSELELGAEQVALSFEAVSRGYVHGSIIQADTGQIGSGAKGSLVIAGRVRRVALVRRSHRRRRRRIDHITGRCLGRSLSGALTARAEAGAPVCLASRKWAHLPSVM